MRKKELDLCNGSLWKNIILFALPLILGNIIQLLFNAADMIVVGRFAGNNSLAAVGSTTSIVSLIVSVFNGFSIGAGVIVAKYYGAREWKKVSETVHTSMLMSLIIGLALIFIGLFFSKKLLTMMSSPSEVINLSDAYLKIYFLSMPGFMIYNFGSAILRSVGDAKRPLYYLTTCGIINVFINLILVIIFKMDVYGVGIATAISQYISALLIIIRLENETGCYHLSIKKLHYNKSFGVEIIKVGLPLGLQSVAMPISNVLIQSSINTFGAVVVAGNSAAVSVENMIYAALKAFQQTLISFVGQNFGANNLKRVRSSFRVCMLYAIITGIILGAGINIIGIPLISIYTNDLASVDIGLLRLRIVCLPYLFCGMMEVANGILSGLGITLPSMLMSILGVSGMRILWLFTVFQIVPTIECLYVSYPISWTITFIAQYICFLIIWHMKFSQKREPAPN